jgi:hypothetical protein
MITRIQKAGSLVLICRASVIILIS